MVFGNLCYDVLSVSKNEVDGDQFLGSLLYSLQKKRFYLIDVFLDCVHLNLFTVVGYA